MEPEEKPAGHNDQAGGSPAGLHRLELAALMALVAVFFALCFGSLRQKSVTIDEFAHLPTGLSNIRLRQFIMYSQNPPLLRVLAALPVSGSEVNLPLAEGWHARNHWWFGYDFMYANREVYHDLFVRARMVTVILGALLVVAVWWWTRSLHGRTPALAAAALCAFSPNLIAHSRLVTTDVGSALFLFLSVLTFWGLCRRPTWPRAGLAGLVLGLALLTKFTALMLLPLLPVLAATRQVLARERKLLKAFWVRAPAVFILAYLVFNTGYLWKGFSHPVEKYRFHSRLLSKLALRIPGRCPVPLPRDYVEGFDKQSYDTEGRFNAYLFGEVSRNGWWYYYLVALAAKVPVPTLLLILGGMAALIVSGRQNLADGVFVLVPPLALIAAMTFFTDINIGVRYLLPAFPYFFMMAAGLFRPGVFSRAWVRPALSLLVGLHVISGLLIYPHYLAYFNFIAGGPEGGHRVLADSNLDWGQDLIGLKRYMEDNNIDHVCLLYFGNPDPAIYGIDYELPHDLSKCDVLAASVNYIKGFNYTLNDHSRLINTRPESFSWLRKLKPVDTVGYSIWIFHPNEKAGEED